MSSSMRLYTVSDVASILRVKKSYVYDLICQGRLKAFRISERRIRVPESALEEFILSGVSSFTPSTVITPPRMVRRLRNGVN